MNDNRTIITTTKNHTKKESIEILFKNQNRRLLKEDETGINQAAKHEAASKREVM